MITIKPDDVYRYVRDAKSLGKVGFDTETDGLRPFDEGDRICGFSLYHPELGSLFVPVRMRGLFSMNAPEETISELQPLLDGSVRLIGHHLVFDLDMLMAEDLDVSKVDVWDTQYGAFLYNDSLESYALKGPRALSATLLRDRNASLEADALAKWTKSPKNKDKPWSMAPLELLAGRAERDAILTWRLHEWLVDRFAKLRPGYEPLIDLEMRWVKLLAKMQSHGLLWDHDRAREITRSHEGRLLRLYTGKLQPLGFHDGKVTPAQVLRFCRSKGLDVSDTEELTLQLHRHEVPELVDVLEYRHLAHVLSSFIYPLDRYARKGSGRIYTTFGGTGYKSYSNDAHDSGSTRTGRLRTSKPNLMGIPVYDKDIERTKECFIAPPGCVLAFIDISQADIRVAAHYLGDQRLIDELTDPNGDLHTMISKETGIPRTKAKRIVFGAGLYGAGDEKTALTLMQESHEYVSVTEAASLKNIFHSRYPKFRRTMASVEEVATKRRYIRLWDGRRINFGPEDDPHKAWNWLVQGGVAAIVKRWMMKTDDYIAAHGLSMRMLLQVHDELVFECPVGEVEHIRPIAKLIEGIGPNDGKFNVPLFTSVKIGERWSEAVPEEHWKAQASASSSGVSTARKAKARSSRT